ncbi:MAG: trimethylamine methyltransferase family protein [Desulfobacteraceae bacterium]|nr:trimethylamine methyltransferase family protein [Desulfobacteraceae bacterium]
MTARFAELLTFSQVEQVHETSLEILENVGILVRNEEARGIFAKHGCLVDSETLIVKLRRSVIEYFRAAIPPTFTFHGRDPEYDRSIPGDGPLMVTGSSAPHILDLHTGQVRRSRSDDIARIAHLVNELPGYDIFSISVTADDAPPGQYALSRFYPALKHCLKPVRGSAPSMDEIERVLHLGAIIAGSEAAFWERPFVTFQYCPLVSPLTLDVESTEKLIRYTERGIPSYGVVAPSAGVSAPFTLTGTLALTNAEFLAQSVLEQMVRAGKPIVYDPLPTVADMRTGAYAPGAIETGILLMGCAQMARYYNIPSGGFVGLTNAKTNDAQSGFETGMSTVAALLAGLDLLNMGGLLDALMVFDFAKLLIDNEIALMLKQTNRGLQFNEENLALDTIVETGPGGTFLNKLHTKERMMTTALLPEIADRAPREQWEAKGMPDAQAQAMQRVQEILTSDNPAVFSPAVDARIRAEFEGLVAGDSIPLNATSG